MIRLVVVCGLALGSVIAGVGKLSENEILQLGDLDATVLKLGDPDLKHQGTAGKILYYRSVPIAELPAAAGAETKQGKNVVAGLVLHFGENNKLQSWNWEHVMVGGKGKNGEEAVLRVMPLFPAADKDFGVQLKLISTKENVGDVEMPEIFHPREKNSDMRSAPRRFLVSKTKILDTGDFESVDVVYGLENADPFQRSLRFTLNHAATERLVRLAQDIHGKQVGLLIDGQLIHVSTLDAKNPLFNIMLPGVWTLPDVLMLEERANSSIRKYRKMNPAPAP